MRSSSGILLGTSPLTVSSHLTGDEHDWESSLEHTLFRQYASTQGRWLTPDPAGLAAVNISNPQSWNRYAYVMNNPAGLVDPLGLVTPGGPLPPPPSWSPGGLVGPSVNCVAGGPGKPGIEIGVAQPTRFSLAGSLRR